MSRFVCWCIVAVSVVLLYGCAERQSRIAVGLEFCVVDTKAGPGNKKMELAGETIHLVLPVAMKNPRVKDIYLMKESTGVGLELAGPSVAEFATLTAAVIGERLAIVFDGRVYAAPFVRERIPGGRLMISCADEKEAHDLHAALESAGN